jgi:hypothetical protein
LIFVALVHERQFPVQAVSQQNPSAQKPVVHWPGAPHAEPCASFATQLPPEQ